LRKFVFIALAAIVGLTLAAAALGHAQATGTRSAKTAQTVFGLTNSGRLVSFDQASPWKLLSKVQVTGLAAGEQLQGIDFRPANGKLYGLSNRGQLYVIDHVSGAAGKVGSPIQPVLEPGPIGFDFNPVVDRIRVVGAQGQNLRLNPDTGAVAAVDGRLAFAAGDANAGKQPRVTRAGYTNPDNDPATGTTLYDIDVQQDVLVVQNPPNDGTLQTVGRLRTVRSDDVGFDISASGDALPSAPLGDRITLLHRVDLMTGRAQALGVVGGFEAVRDIAIAVGTAR
jgi:hypothetical protein